MKQFEVGKKYSTTSICDSDCVFVIEITKRTAKTITFRRQSGEERRTKIRVDDNGVEYIAPYRYSMAPVFHADDECSEAPAEEEAQAVPDAFSWYMPKAPQPAPQPPFLMVGQRVLANCGAAFPVVGGVIIGFAEQEATPWAPASTVAVIRWSDGRQDCRKLSDIHPQGWRSESGSPLGVFFAR